MKICEVCQPFFGSPIILCQAPLFFIGTLSGGFDISIKCLLHYLATKKRVIREEIFFGGLGQGVYYAYVIHIWFVASLCMPIMPCQISALMNKISISSGVLCHIFGRKCRNLRHVYSKKTTFDYSIRNAHRVAQFLMALQIYSKHRMDNIDRGWKIDSYLSIPQLQNMELHGVRLLLKVFCIF